MNYCKEVFLNNVWCQNFDRLSSSNFQTPHRSLIMNWIWWNTDLSFLSISLNLPPSVAMSQKTFKGFPLFSGSIQYSPSPLESPEFRMSSHEWAGWVEIKPLITIKESVQGKRSSFSYNTFRPWWQLYLTNLIIYQGKFPQYKMNRFATLQTNLSTSLAVDSWDPSAIWPAS